MKYTYIRIVLAILATVPVSAIAQSWTSPTATPPSGNVSAPLNVSSSNQIKSGGISVGSISVTGGAYIAGSLGVGTSSPAFKLSVVGDVNLTGALRVNGIAGAAGQVLQSTGSGLAWVSTSTLSAGSSSSTPTSSYTPPGKTIRTFINASQHYVNASTYNYTIPVECTASTSLNMLLHSYAVVSEPQASLGVIMRYVSGGTTPAWYSAIYPSQYYGLHDFLVGPLSINGTVSYSVPVAALGGPGARVYFYRDNNSGYEHGVWIENCR